MVASERSAELCRSLLEKPLGVLAVDDTNTIKEFRVATEVV